MLSSVVFSMPIPTQVCPPLSEFYKVVKPLVKREVPFIELIASWHFHLKAKQFKESSWHVDIACNILCSTGYNLH
jgi:hypothetical protein